MHDDAQVVRALRSGLAVAARGVDPPGELPPRLLARVRARRRLALLSRAFVVLVAVGLGATAFAAVINSTEDANVIAGAGNDTGTPRARDVISTIDTSPNLGLLSLRNPTVTPIGDGFIVWGGIGGTEPFGSDEDPGLLHSPPDHAYGTSGVGAVYSTASDSWTTLPPSPLGPRSGHVALWTGSELFIAGGAQTMIGEGVHADAAAYSPRTGSWRSLPSLPEPRADAAGIFVNGRIVIAGGSTSSGQNSDTVLIGTGAEPWSELRVDHRVHGVVPIGDDAVVYGFDDEAADELRFTLIDVNGESTSALPDLQAEGDVYEFGVGTNGGTIYAVTQIDDAVAVDSITPGDTTWIRQREFVEGIRLLPQHRWAARGVGGLLIGDSSATSVTDRGVYRFGLDTGEPQRLFEVPRRCDSATTFGSSVTTALFWVDHSCDAEGSAFVIDIGVA